jgi:hypothetical protein
MAKAIYEWNLTAAANNFATADGGMPEGQTRKSLNNAARERMRATREFYDTGMEFGRLMRDPADGSAFTTAKLSDTEIRVTSGANDMSSYFTANRRIQTLTSDVVQASHFVDSVSFANPYTDVTIRTDAGYSVVPAGIDEVRLHQNPTLGRLAFQDTVPADFTVPTDNTDAAFAAALAIISAAGGGTLLLREDGPSILENSHSITFPCRIVGNGPQAGIKQDDAADLEQMLLITGVAVRDVQLEGFTVDGNRANQTGGTGNGIVVTDGAGRVTFRDLYVKSTRHHGVYLNNSSGATAVADVTFANYRAEDTGGDGIGSLDPNSDMDAIQVIGANIDSPGQEQTTSAGIKVLGRWTLSGIVITGLDLGGGSTQRGVWFGERLAADPNPQDAHNCSMSGFSISGTGGNARGVEIDGDDCVISGGVIEVTGGTSRGVFMGGSLGSQAPKRNRVSDVVITGANIGVLVQGTAIDNTVSVRTSGCTVDINTQGDQITIRDCELLDASDDSIQVVSGSNDVAIFGNLIDGAGVDGVDVASGAATVDIENNVFRNISGDAIEVDDAVTGWKAWPNEFRSISGSNLKVTGGVTDLSYDATHRARTFIEGVQQDNFGLVEIPLTGMNDVPFPIPPDGTRRFVVGLRLDIAIPNDDNTFRIRLGTALFSVSPGTIVADDTQTIDGAYWLTKMILTPAKDEKVSVTVDNLGGSDTHDVNANNDDVETYFEIEYLDG